MDPLCTMVSCSFISTRRVVLYCGTSTGDVLKVRLNFHHDPDVLEPVKQPCVIGCFARLTRKRLPRGQVDLYELGVRSIKRLFNGQLIIGAGDGTLELVQEAPPKIIQTDVKLPSVPALKIIKSTNVNASITSLQLMGETTLLAGTVRCEIYIVDLNEFKARLLVTCHTSTIYDVAFPHNFSEVFASASHDSVRIWSTTTLQELLRMRVQNFRCSAVTFTRDGRHVLTAWDDGVIRAFTPLTGRLAFAIPDAHNKGVSALAVTSHGRILVSGGCEGQVRLWNVTPYRQELICTLKEHKGPVSAIHINKFDTEAASASTDGTCIIWDLERQCRRQILFANTLFMCVRYYPTGVQIITGGSDRKLAYWEVLDGSLVRELEGSPTGTINTLDISPDGEYIVSGGNDQIVKLWTYQEGVTTHIGLGHAAVITSARFSPDGKYIVTANASGGIFIYECPQKKPTQSQDAKKAVKEAEEPQSGRTDKQENIRDLPTARSQQESARKAKSTSSKSSCKCPSESVSSTKTKSSEKLCEEVACSGDADSVRSSCSLRHSQKSFRSSMNGCQCPDNKEITESPKNSTEGQIKKSDTQLSKKNLEPGVQQ